MSAPPERFELGIDDSGYPEQLRHSERPPGRLYGIGDPATLTPGMAEVGARRATPYGLRAATLFAGWAASTDFAKSAAGRMGAAQTAAATMTIMKASWMYATCTCLYGSNCDEGCRHAAGRSRLQADNHGDNVVESFGKG